MDGTGDGYECNAHRYPPGVLGNSVSLPECPIAIVTSRSGQVSDRNMACESTGRREGRFLMSRRSRPAAIAETPVRARCSAGWNGSCVDAKKQRAGRSMICRPKSVFVSGETKCRCTEARWSSSVAMLYRPPDGDVMIRRPICLRSSGNKCLPAFPES